MCRNSVSAGSTTKGAPATAGSDPSGPAGRWRPSRSVWRADRVARPRRAARQESGEGSAVQRGGGVGVDANAGGWEPYCGEYSDESLSGQSGTIPQRGDAPGNRAAGGFGAAALSGDDQRSSGGGWGRDRGRSG